MEVKFEQTVVALLAIQIVLLFMTYTIVSDYLTEEDDEYYYKDSCSCYCDYPYYWYAEEADPMLDADAERGNSTGDNSTEE